jgi:GntR family transcriptional repressor for pyruvate dehydrogenase complex
MDLTPISHTRISDSAITQIKDFIIANKMRPGDKLPSERELSKKLQISRASTREAIRILEIMGLVHVQPGKGIFIDDLQGRRFKEFSTWLKHNEQNIKEHFEVRMILESKVAKYAAQKADKEDIRRLEETHAQLVKCSKDNNIEEAIVCDGRFHRYLAAATKNETLHVLMKAITTKLATGWISSLYTPGRLEKTTKEHGAILASVKKGDAAGAENSMTLHLANAVHDISCHMATQRNGDDNENYHSSGK